MLEFFSPQDYDFCFANSWTQKETKVVYGATVACFIA